MPGRRERRVRERGRPAPAVVVDARAAGEGWRARVRVEPAEGEPFEARLDLTTAGGEEPRPGDVLEVLHHGRDAIALSHPAQLRRPAPAAPETADVATTPPPSAHDVIGLVLRRLADGSLTGGGPAIVLDDPGPGALRPLGTADPALSALTLADLIARAEADPSPVADEVLRRLGAGATTFERVLDEARAVGPAGEAAVRAVLDDLHARGLIGTRTRGMLRRLSS